MWTKNKRRMIVHQLRNWDFFLCNGEFAGTFSYSREMIKAHFHGAKIKGSDVILVA